MFICLPIVLTCQVNFEKTYGGVSNEYSHSVLQTDDNGYLLCGYTSSYGYGSEDVYVVKTNESGDIEWDHTYGGYGDDHGYYITKTNDGGYIFCAESTSFGTRKAYVVKINSEGDTLWTNTYEGLYRSNARQILQTDDGGYIVCGSTSSTQLGPKDVFLFKTNEIGALLWSKNYGGTNEDFAYAISKSLNGGYVLCGGTKSFGAGNYDVYIINTNDVGDTIWTKTIGGGGYDAGYSIFQKETGNILIGGVSSSFGSNTFDLLISNLNENGETIWTNTIDYFENEHGCYISQTSDNCISGCGYTSDLPVTNSDILIFKMDYEGDTIWTKTFGGNSYEVGYGIFETSDLGFIVTGYTQSYGAGNSDMYLIKTNSEGILTSIDDPILEINPIEVYPNPFNHKITIETRPDYKAIEVYDLNGNNHFSKLLNQENKTEIIDLRRLKKGIYILKIRTDGQDITKKIIKI